MQHITVFISLGKTLNFTKTAEKLHITQPGISKSIRALEGIVGFKLFERTSKQVALTPEGEFLLEEWQHVPELIHSACKTAESMKLSRNERLRIGIAFTVDSSRFISAPLEEFSEKYSACAFEILENDIQYLWNALDRKELDVIFLPDMEKLNLDPARHFAVEVCTAPACVFLHPDNPLYGRESLRVTDFASMPLCVLNPQINPAPLKMVRSLYSRHGQKLKVEHFYSSRIHLFNFLDKNPEYIHVNDGFYSFHSNIKFKMIPIEDEKSLLLAVSNKENQKDIISDMLRMICSYEK